MFDTSAELPALREAMTAATLDGQPLREHDEPRVLCTRLIAAISREVQEISRRSGAAGELVLRKNIGQGRREEIYITKAELLERVLTLPPGLRPAFDPLHLTQGPRSPRAPSPSAPTQL